MAVPKLTDLLKKEADQAFTKEISAEIWEGIGKELGFSDEEVKAATPIATRSAAGIELKPEKKRRVSRKVIFGAAVAVAVAAAAVIAFCGPFLKGSGPILTISDDTVPMSSFPTQSASSPGIRWLAEVRYPAGAEVTMEEFLADAQAEVPECDGAGGEYRVFGFEDIDFAEPGTYFVQVETGQDEEQMIRIIAVIIE